MRPDEEALIALRSRIETLRASACGMAHESIPTDPDGKPVPSARSPSGFARVGICPEAVRNENIACSHTMARYLLRDAVMRLPGEGTEAILAALHDLEQEISLLDHRRYDAESRRAAAMLAKGSDDAAALEIAGLVAEHRACVTRAESLRAEVLRRIDDALCVARAVASPAAGG